MGIANDFWHNFQELKNNVESHTGILTGIGIGMAVVGTVLACRAAVKISQKVPEHQKMVDDKKKECEAAQMPPQETKKEVRKVYGKIAGEYVKKFLPAGAVMIVGYGLIVRAHMLEVAKNEALMTAYVALQGLFAKYRMKVAENIGEEQEQALFDQAKVEQAREISQEYNGPFVNGSYILYNNSCADFVPCSPQANDFTITSVERELNMKYGMCKRVYINDIMRALGHEDIKDGWKYCYYKGVTGPVNFKLHDPVYNPEFARGYGFEKAGGEDCLAKLYLDDCVHVNETYKAEVRRNDLADGGVIGGRIGQNPVIIG